VRLIIFVPTRPNILKYANQHKSSQILPLPGHIVTFHLPLPLPEISRHQQIKALLLPLHLRHSIPPLQLVQLALSPLSTRPQRTPRIIRPRQQLIRLIRIHQRCTARLVPEHHRNLPQDARDRPVVASGRPQLRYVACLGQESECRVHISKLEFGAAERIVGGRGDGVDREFGRGDGERGLEGPAGAGVEFLVELDVAVGVMAAVERVSTVE
jgi:hypothetical protein